MGAPLGVLCYARGLQDHANGDGRGAVGGKIASLHVRRRSANSAAAAASRGASVWLYGAALCWPGRGLASSRRRSPFMMLCWLGWRRLALTLFSVAFVGTRLPFPQRHQSFSG